MAVVKCQTAVRQVQPVQRFQGQAEGHSGPPRAASSVH